MARCLNLTAFAACYVAVWLVSVGCDSGDARPGPQRQTAERTAVVQGNSQQPKRLTSPAPAAEPAAQRSIATRPAKSKTIKPTETSGDVGKTRSPRAAPEPAVGVAEPAEASRSARLQAAGLRRLVSKHLTLYTDLPRQPAIDELGAVFDLAVPQWCSFFSVDPARVDTWHMTAYLIGDRQLFAQLGVLHDGLPPFLHGYQMGAEIWCYEQPSDYYRRHLLLHEGTHGFMNNLMGGAGPPWYMEGTAELLATHRWADGRLTLKVLPADRGESSYWGRIKAIKDELKADRGMTMREIMRYDERAHLSVEPYAWCWAISTFLEQHPLTQTAFADLRHHTRERGFAFSRRLAAQLEDDWSLLTHQWQMFVRTLDYGYDVERELFGRRPVKPAGSETERVVVAVDRGWQSTGLKLVGGTAYEIKAEGRYRIANDPKSWWCEPNGVTIRYHRGLPLGMLVAAVLGEGHVADANSPLLHPLPIGLARRITAERDGTLYLRINEAPNEHHDNDGEVDVRVRQVSDSVDSPIDGF